MFTDKLKRVDENKSDDRKKEMTGLLLSVFLIMIASVAGFAVSGYFPAGKRIYLYGDYYIQYIGFIKLFWRELLSGDKLNYSFSASMGQPTSLLYAYYCLSPCNVFFAFVSDPDTAGYLVMLSKQVLAAGFFYLFCSRVLQIRGTAATLFAAFYAQCGYLVNFFSHINLMDSLYFLPLILMLLWRFVRSGKWHALCLAYALSFIVCFYGGYQTGIFSFLAYIVFLYYFYGKPTKLWLKSIGDYVLCVGTAALLSAVVTLPAAWQLLQADTVQVMGVGALRTHIWDVPASLFIGRNYGIAGEVPIFYCGILVFYTVPIFFFSKKTGRRVKILFLIPMLFLLLCIFVKPLYLLMHAFDMPDGNYYRFTYMISFLLSAMSAWLIENRDYQLGAGSRRPVIVMALCSAVYLLISYLQRRFPIGDSGEGMTLLGLEYNVVFLGVYAFLLFGIKGGKRAKLLALIIVGTAENIMNAGFSNLNDDNGLERRRDYYSLWIEEGKKSLTEIEQMQGEKEDFYRIRYENAVTPNNASYWGYNGIGYFSSIEQTELKMFMYKMGYFAADKAWMVDYGGTPLMQALLAQKYVVHGSNPRTEESVGVYVNINEKALPLAFMVSDRLKAYHADGEDPFQNQERLVSCMLNEEIHIFEPCSAEPQIYTENVQEAWFNTGRGWILNPAEDRKGYIFMEIAGDERRGYCYFSQTDFYDYFNTARVVTGKDGGLPMMFSYLYTPHIMEMKKNAQGNYGAGIIIDNPQIPIANYSNAYFYYLDEQAMDDALERLGEGGVILSEQKDHSLTGKTNTGGGLLFTSIPYDENWEVYVDGSKAECFSICDGAFLAIDLPEGEHELRFCYSEKWGGWGFCTSVMGGLIYIGTFFYLKKKRIK